MEGDGDTDMGNKQISIELLKIVLISFTIFATDF